MIKILKKSHCCFSSNFHCNTKSGFFSMFISA